MTEWHILGLVDRQIVIKFLVDTKSFYKNKLLDRTVILLPFLILFSDVFTRKGIHP